MTWNILGTVIIVLLRILGILLLIALVLVLLVLFAPIRYRVRLVWDETGQLSGRLCWLGFVLRAPFAWDGTQFDWKLRVFGIPVYRGSTGEPDAETYKTSRDAQTKNEKEKKTTEQAGAENVSQKQQTSGTNASVHTQKQKNISSFRKRVQNLVAGIWRGLRLLRHRIRSARDFVALLQEDFTKRFICIARENMIHLWRQLRPRKIQGAVCFGTGDPCSTGQILGGLGAAYGWIGSGVRITPDFEQACLQGRLEMKGRIRMITVVTVTLRIVFHRDIKRLRREWERWKEEI